MSAIAASPRVLVETVRIAWVRDFVLVLAATTLIAASAQIAIPLPFSPVPLTGQTLGVLLSVASLGAWRGLSATGLYFAAALAGFPVLAPTADGGHVTGIAVLSMPSLGYLLGFIVAAVVVGRLAERGYTRTFGRTMIAMIFGNLSIYLVGLVVLQAVTGADIPTTLQWGLYPFIIGDLLKAVLAAGLLPSAWRVVQALESDS
jgi:biotin transport system substrate-specific component